MPKLTTRPVSPYDPFSGAGGVTDEALTLSSAAAPEPEPEPAPVAKKSRKGPAPAQPKPAKNATLDEAPIITGGLPKIGSSLDETEDYANVMFSGEGGTGKTTCLADMARLGRVIVINAESGLKGKPLRAMGIPIENITVWPDPKKNESLTWESLDKLIWNIKAQLEAEPGSIVGVMMDSATEVHIKLLDIVREDSVKKSLSKDKDRDPFKTELQDYGIMTEQMRNILRRMRDLPCHFGVSTLHKRDKDDDGKVVYRSDMTEKLANSLFGYVDICVVTTVAEAGGVTDYIGLTKPKGKFRGKDRFGVLPEKMVNPTFSRIVGYMNGAIDRESDEYQIDARNRRMAEPPPAEEEEVSADADVPY